MGKDAGIADLSQRELEVARAYAQGDNYRTAAARLFIAPSTLRTHIRTIYRKLGVSSKIELLRALESVGAVESATGKPGSAIPSGRTTAVSDPRAWSAQPSAGLEDAGSSAKPELVKRSIAVLSFDNMSRDSETGHMGDGIAEDIITALSKIARMRVIARYSTFAYKGQAQDVREIARALSVRYVLEGSVRRSGSRIRIVARLIDTEDEARHIWAERYDRELADIFDIQDEITKEIVTALRVKLTDGESAAVWSRGTNSVAAWERAVRATDLFQRFNVVDYLEARRLAEEAVALDPNYGYAHARVGWTWWWDARLGFTGRSEE
jgi:TolB-like protein/DNA-binding CsgD family transcriptional regulator